MVKNRKVTGKAKSIPAGLLTGCVMSLAVTMILAGILAKLLENEYLAQEQIGYGIMVILLVSSYAGAAVSFGCVKRQRLVTCMLSGLVYFSVLLSITALFFGGQYDAVAVTALIVLCGSSAAALLHTEKKTGHKPKKIKLPNC